MHWLRSARRLAWAPVCAAFAAVQVEAADGGEEDLAVVTEGRGGLDQPGDHLELLAQRTGGERRGPVARRRWARSRC